MRIGNYEYYGDKCGYNINATDLENYSNSGSTAKQIGTVEQRETTTTHQKTALQATVAPTQSINTNDS